MPLDTCQWRIAAVSYAGFCLLLIGIFWFTGARGDENHQADWAWFSASTAPCTVMITGALARAIKQRAKDKESPIDRRFCWLALMLSVGYWVLLFTIFVLEVWFRHENKGYFVNSQLAIAPLQGLMISVLNPIFSQHTQRRSGSRVAKSDAPSAN